MYVTATGRTAATSCRIPTSEHSAILEERHYVADQQPDLHTHQASFGSSGRYPLIRGATYHPPKHPVSGPLLFLRCDFHDISTHSFSQGGVFMACSG